MAGGPQSAVVFAETQVATSVGLNVEVTRVLLHGSAGPYGVGARLRGGIRVADVGDRGDTAPPGGRDPGLDRVPGGCVKPGELGAAERREIGQVRPGPGRARTGGVTMTADITMADAITALVAEQRAVGYKYENLPAGLNTALTYGLSLADHPDWRYGRPKLCIS